MTHISITTGALGLVLALLLGIKVTSVSATSSATSTIPYSAHDLANPLRGQYSNLGADLFPQSNKQQSLYYAWPKTPDASIRLDWSTLQPIDPRTIPESTPASQKYDFTVLDDIITANNKEGRRTGFRVTTFNSCCQQTFVNNINTSSPGWLQTVPGATKKYLYNGVTHVIPEWNNQNYLRYIKELITALGERYDHDERVSIYEFSGYGDFSENHNAFMRDTLKLPATPPDRSETELGYYSQYQDQYITKASIIQLTDATLDAFEHTQIVTAPGNPEITKQLYSENKKVATIGKPVGNRSDCLGEFSTYPTWVDNQWSEYVKRNDPFTTIFKDRYKTAPIITEWCNFQTADDNAYYAKGLTDTVRQHVSMLASTGFPAQPSDTQMSQDLYERWVRANKYSGYRYAPTSVGGLRDASADKSLSLEVAWTNFGSAPTYEEWKVIYEIVDEKDKVIQEAASATDLRKLYADQSDYSSENEPNSATIIEKKMIDLGNLSDGKYSLMVRVAWNEHKPAATYTVNYPPMQLAINGRTERGSYTLGSFTIGDGRVDNLGSIWARIAISSATLATIIGVVIYGIIRRRKRSLGQQ